MKIKLRFLNSREFAIENNMFRMAEFRHCFFDSPWVSQVRSRFKSVLHRPSDLAPGVCMQRRGPRLTPL